MVLPRYFIDVSRLAVLRLSNDGITEIDNYKMNNYFSNKCKELISSGVEKSLMFLGLTILNSLNIYYHLRLIQA